MKKVIFYFFVSLLLIAIYSCSGTKGGKDRANPVKYKKKIEKVTRIDFQNKSRSVLMNRHQFQFFRNEDSEGQQYIETDWRYRPPFEDELNSGIVEARSKIVLTAFPRNLTDPSALWVTNLEGLNEVRLEGSSAWVTLPMTVMAKKYFDKIADDLNIEFRMGVRAF